MSCQNCYNGCSEIHPDACIKYTGANIPLLGIETGDSLLKFEQEVVNKLVAYSTGLDIDLSAITLDCAFIQDFLGCCKDKTLVNIIQALISASCTLRQLIKSIEDVVFAQYSFDTACLTLPPNPTKDDIIQALVTKVCSMSGAIDTISSDYVKATDLDSLIAQYLTSLSGNTQQYAKMVPFIAYEYYGPISNFDNSGKGITSVGFEKVYICNGANGTPDKRGRVAVGAIQGVPGGSLDVAVDPTLPQNAGTNYVLGQKWGTSFVSLAISQIPPHNHAVSDPGHAHHITGSSASSFTSGGYCLAGGLGSGPENAGNTDAATTGITIANTGGGQPHDNRQPSIAALFIMYIP